MSKRTWNFSKLLDSSEMFCSLKYEDVKGCPYNAFTPRGIAALSITSSFLAIISLFIGV